MRRILRHTVEKTAAIRVPALALAAALGLGCADGSTEIDAPPRPALHIAAGEEAAPAIAEASPPASRRSEALIRQLREEAQNNTWETALAVDERLRAAESEFPLEFRFSYERAQRAVFGRHEHHEAFGLLRRAAEKAIATERSEAMLEMLRSDGAQSGPFWKLTRGHSEWHQIVEALEHGDREALWHQPHETETAHRVVPENRAATQALAASRPAVSEDGLDRLRLVRTRIGHEQTSVFRESVAADAP